MTLFKCFYCVLVFSCRVVLRPSFCVFGSLYLINVSLMLYRNTTKVTSMVLILQAGTSAFEANQNGIFFPRSDLADYGLDADNMCSDNNLGYGNCIWALSKKIWEAGSNLSNLLGFGFSAPTSANATQDTSGNITTTHTFGGNYQLYLKLSTQELDIVPLPTTGTNLGVGALSFSDLVPNVAKVNNGADTPGAGLLVGFSSLSDEIASLTYNGLDVGEGEDNRLYIAAMFKSFGRFLPIRTTDVQSPFLTRTLSSLGSTTVPATYTRTTNPLSAIPASDVTSGNALIITQSFAYTIQSKTDKDNKITVNVA